MAEGIIYVLTNEAMPGYVKVGKTSTSVTQRIRELDNTSLPYPFECFYAATVAEAYGWPVNLSDEEILERQVALNKQRAVEETQISGQAARPGRRRPRDPRGSTGPRHPNRPRPPIPTGQEG